MLCFRKLSVTKKIMDERGVPGLSIESLLSHSTGKNRRRTPKETVILSCEQLCA